MLEGIEGVSTYASDVDNAFIVVTVITLFLFVVTIGSMFYFVYRFRASKNAPEDTQNIKHYTPIEIVWTVIPTILMMIVFYFGLDSLRVQRTMPKDDESIVVKVLAQRWSWQFEYANGKKSQELTVPLNSKIKLIMTAPPTDVLHAFFVPAFRAKEDIVPGQTTYLWFNATVKGKYDIQCAEYCGTRHSYMRSFVNVVSQDEFNDFITPKKVQEKETALDIMGNLGCTGCHSLDGTVLVGPSFKDMYNKKGVVFTNDKKRVITKDEAYLRNSILNPNDDIVEDFAPQMMPSFKDSMTIEQLDIVISFLKGEKSKIIEKMPKPDAKELLQNNGCIGCHSLDGTRVVGPTFQNIFGKKSKVEKNGKVIEIVIDEKYLKTSILSPKEDVVVGYPNIMPAFKGILKDEEVDAIIEYLKEIK